MLPFVPVTFDVYRPLKPRLRWAMQCLVSFADRSGRCWPSIRTFARYAGISKSAAGRDLAALTEAGMVRRQRRPGGSYIYQIGRQFLPQWAREKVSQAWDRQREARRARRATWAAGAVPVHGTKEKPGKKNQGSARARVSYGEMSDEHARWAARLRSWRKSGFWLPLWGAKPGEAGCLVPPALLSQMGDGR